MKNNTQYFKEGDLVKVKPECISEITYTNTPSIDEEYKIRIVFGGDTWTYGLSHKNGGDACIHISHKHVQLVNENS